MNSHTPLLWLGDDPAHARPAAWQTRWARMHGTIFREVAPHVGRDDRAALHRSIGGRYFNAAQYAWRGGRYGDILPHLPHAAWHLLAAYAERLRR